MNEQQTFVVEITRGEGKQWFCFNIGERFLVVVDLEGSRGCAKYRVVEEPLPIYSIEECLNYQINRYIPAECCTVVDDDRETAV